MEPFLSVLAGVVIVILLAVIFEFRIRQPDHLVLYESNGEIKIRKGLIYPRHFSLALKRTAHPIQLNTEIAAAGNLMVSIKLVGSVALSAEHLPSLIRSGGWSRDAVAHAADEAQVLLQSLIQGYTETLEVQTLSSNDILNFLNQQSFQIQENLGVEIISLGILSLEPSDPEVTSALRQQEQARLLEQTEELNQQARAAAARAKHKTDEELAAMEHDLELKKVRLKTEQLEEEESLSQQRLEYELARNRMRLAFEKEEVDLIRSSPELLMLTPQAARLAEASQNLKNARTVISFTPQDLANNSDLMDLFQALLQRALDAKKDAQKGD